ncbi:MAG: hypothetical protein V7K21_13270 [Nostoc sp.]|uniref:hypothetical protein n=1 Tax=Nostoc sp. TaxID=1180 RepID=UPI002FF4B41D
MSSTTLKQVKPSVLACWVVNGGARPISSVLSGYYSTSIRQVWEPDLTFLEDLDSIDITGDKQLKKSAAARYAAEKLHICRHF